MAETFDAYQFAQHLLRRWRVAAAAVAGSAALAAAVSLALPQKYTSTAKLLILPPGGSDPRTLTAVSPVYLDSLHTYEHFASSPSLFERAVSELGLAAAGGRADLESLQREALEVALPRNTKVLEISATWSDPKKAQALAGWIAQQTVALSEKMNREDSAATVEQVRELSRQAEERVRRAEEEHQNWARENPIAGLEEQIDERIRQRSSLENQLLWLSNRREEEADARREELTARITTLDQQIERDQALLSRRTARGEAIASERKAAWAELERARVRLLEQQSVAAGRGERLQIIDPGVVPQKPSSPNILLNTIAAVFLGLMLSLLAVTLEFSYQQRKAESRRRNLRLAGHG